MKPHNTPRIMTDADDRVTLVKVGTVEEAFRRIVEIVNEHTSHIKINKR